MIVHVLTMLTDWLQADVNARLESVPRLTLGGDTPDPTPAPLAFIADEFRDDRVAEAKAPPRTPALYVTRNGALSLAGEAMTDSVDSDAPLSVAVRLLHDAPNTAAGARAVEYYLRAVINSARAWCANENAAARALDGVLVQQCRRALWTPWSEDVGECRVTGVVVLELDVRDALLL